MALVNGGFLHYMDIKKFLNLLRNRRSDIEIISQECSLGDPFQKVFAKFWSIHKHGSGEWGLLALYEHEEVLKKSSSPKPLVRFWNNFTGMFLGWLFSKFVREILICQKTWLWWIGASCTIWGHEEILKKSSPKLLVRFWNDFTGMFLCWPFSKCVRKIVIRP